MSTPKTLEEHCNYLYEIVKLQLFFAFNHQQEHPEESWGDIVNNRIDIFRKSACNPEGLNPSHCDFEQPCWIALLQASESLLKTGVDADGFEKTAFEVFKPTLNERCERDYLDQSWRNGYLEGNSLRAESKLDDDEFLPFHIANMITPESIFTNPQYLPNCFLQLIKSARKAGAKGLKTCSWLNDYRPWLNIFPQPWLESLSPKDTNVAWHYGFWGQFLNARLAFNFKAGKFMRATGQMPCYPRLAQCNLGILEQHFSLMLEQ